MASCLDVKVVAFCGSDTNWMHNEGKMCWKQE